MLNERPVTINFAQGLNTKTDPWQLPIGQFESLENTIFQTGSLLKKRNGYGEITPTTPPSSYVTTLNDNLTSIGSTINAYSASLGQWITKGTLQPCSLDVLPLIRNNLTQSQSDTVVSSGMVLTTFTQTGSGSTQYLYVLADVVTGQNIFKPSALPVLSTGAIQGSSRTFVIGNYFVIVSPVTVSAVNYLQYVSIPISNPVKSDNTPNVSAAQNVTADVYVSISANPGWDGVTVNNASNNVLVVAYNTTTGAQGIHVASLTEQQVATNAASTIIKTFANAAYKAAVLSICVDLTVTPNIFYVSFWNNSTTNGYTLAVIIGLGTITQQFAPQQIITSSAVVNLASAAQSNSCLVFSEVTTAYSYDAAVPSNLINAVTVSSAGVVGTPYVAVRSVGIASKAFIISSQVYFLSAYSSPFQPTFFLMNGSTTTAAAPIIVSKLAYQNAGGYVTLGLPSVTITDGIAQVSYLFKDDVEALNTLNNTQQTTAGGIYSQIGINLVSFDINTTSIVTAEIAQNLHITGGYLGQYDGYLPVEHNFFLFPDSIECTWSTSGGSIAAQPDGSTNTNAYFYQVTYEWTDNQGFAYRSAPSIPVAVTTTSTGTSGSITVNVPYLRLTAKVSNKVKIVIYRWSVANQVYYQVTSITSPTLNSTTADSVAYVDTLADASIIGNNILYTAGGVVPDCNAPSSKVVTLFDTRVWLLDAENPNTWWISKQVIPGTPVEMSTRFTIYVSPTTGTPKSLGPITAAAPMDDKIINFFSEGISYINGVGPDNIGTTSVGCSLGNYSQPIFITSVVGCDNQASIVLTPAGLMFQSDKGIWILGRNLQEDYIGADVEAYNSFTVTSAQMIPKTNFVLFTLNTNVILMYDYYYKQWGTFTGVEAVSSCIYNGLHTILDEDGAIIQETPGQYLDKSNPVLIKFKTSWLNLASLQGYERFRDFYILAKYLSPHFMLCQVAYDYNSSILNQKIIRPTNFSPATPSPFGVPTPFGSPGNKEQWRIHAKQQLCQSFQLTVTEVFDASVGSVAGAGFTMSGITANIVTKKATRPIKAANTAGMS